MTTANLRLVAAVSRRYSGLIQQRGLSLADGLQEGAIGLMRGVEKFDPERGYKFSTFGYWWARQGIARWAHTGGVIRLPQNVAEMLCKLSPAEIAALPDRERATADAGLAALRMGWLDAPAGGGEASPLSEFLAADEGDALEALGDEIEMARLQALEPAAWADGVAAVSSRCGLNSARGRRILDTLRAA
jgi:RNA polymerase sigma factor (sigma-70 family)